MQDRMRLQLRGLRGKTGAAANLASPGVSSRCMLLEAALGREQAVLVSSTGKGLGMQPFLICRDGELGYEVLPRLCEKQENMCWLFQLCRTTEAMCI